MTREEITKLATMAAEELSGKCPEGFGITVIVSDMEGFTAVLSNVAPEQNRKWVNRWADKASRAVKDAQALIKGL